MTRNAKAVLLTILGVGAASGLIVVFMIAVIGISLMAAATDAENDNKKTSTTNERKVSRKQSREDLPAAPAGELERRIAGTWYRGEGSGKTDFTGKTQYRSSRRYIYKISVTGEVEYTFERETLTIMQCEIKERRTADGKAATEGDALIINFDEADHAESNSCEGGETVEKSLPAETVRLEFRIKTEDGRPQLCLDEADGEACYEKRD